MNKIRLLMTCLVFVFLISIISAYSINIEMDKSGWDYEQYYCGSDETCSSLTLEDSGYESSDSHIFYYTELYDYNALWIFKDCYRPKVIKWDGCDGCNAKDYFNKKDECVSEFDSLTISNSTPLAGDTIYVYANIQSAFTTSDDSPGLPLYYPSSYSDWYTSEIDVSAVVKDPYGFVIMVLPFQTASIYQDETEEITFTIDTSTFTIPGTYSFEITTDVSDCICDQSNDILVTEEINFDLEFPLVECYTDSDCGTDGYIGDTYCICGDTYRDYRGYTCYNPGESSSYCAYDDSLILQENCGESETITSDNYCIGKDVYYDETNIERGCSGGSCFENSDTDSIFVEECAYACFLGECVGECETDNDCDDGLYCNGEETCNTGTHICETGTSIDCSFYDINQVSTCSYDPDNNPFTFDFYSGFISICDEIADSCTTNPCWISEMTHTCDISECGAECEETSDCTEYPDGICLSNCSCSYSYVPECSDGIDNDGDGLIDLNDPGCENEQDDNETNVFEPCGPENQGVLIWGYCWYIGDSYDQSCDDICGNHSSICINPPVMEDCTLHALLGISCNPSWCVGNYNPPLFAPAFQEPCHNCYYNAVGNYSCSVSGGYYRICACEVGEQEPECGNSILEVGEECDDGNTNNGDGCSSQCVIEYCDDGIVNNINEECDLGINNGQECVPEYGSSCNYCSSICENITLTGGYCGDGIINGEEGCDDGENNGEYGYCNAECTESSGYCGDGIINGEEGCDEGIDNNVTCEASYGGNCTYCNAFCNIELIFGNYCGDEILDIPYEECDDGNTNNGDGCSNSCEVEEEEEDDDDDDDKSHGIKVLSYNITSEVPEKTSYTPPICGNGVLEAGEECDDENNLNGDGCSEECEIEMGSNSNLFSNKNSLEIIPVLLITGIVLIIFLLLLVIGLRKI